VRAVYKAFPERDADYRPLPHRVLVSRLNQMGQVLFAPPNVKGWPGGRAWLNTSTVLERDNFAAALAAGTLWRDPPEAAPFVPAADVPPPRALDPARLLADEGATRPEDVVRVLLDLYVPGGVRAEARDALTAFVADGRPTRPALDRRAREAVHAILTMPEFQLA
jgi:hypothetical protein